MRYLSAQNVPMAHAACIYIIVQLAAAAMLKAVIELCRISVSDATLKKTHSFSANTVSDYTSKAHNLTPSCASPTGVSRICMEY